MMIRYNAETVMMRVLLICVMLMLGLLGADARAAGAFLGKAYDMTALSPKRYETSEALVKKVGEFMKDGWREETLRSYPCAGKPLAVSHWWIPRCYGSFVTRSCGFSNACTAVLLVYRGYVEAPKTGVYRFAGMGDDVLAVRFNGKLVLESGFQLPSKGEFNAVCAEEYQASFSRRREKRALYAYAEIPFWNQYLGGIATGIPFKAEAGKVYPMEVLFLHSGAEAGACLFIEHIKNPKQVPYGRLGVGEAPVLSLFRTQDTLPKKDDVARLLRYSKRSKEIECPPFLSAGPVWNVTPTRPDKPTEKRDRKEKESRRQNRFRRI